MQILERPHLHLLFLKTQVHRLEVAGKKSLRDDLSMISRPLRLVIVLNIAGVSKVSF